MMVSYCSRDCQKKDWKNHKLVCKVLTKLRGKNPHLFHNDPSAQPRVTQALELSLSRRLSQYESDMLTHARICLVCHGADQSTLTNCSKCHCVAYCSDTCREEDRTLHETVCSTLVNCINDYRFQVTKGDRLQCYLPPMLEEKKALNLNFEKMFANHCDKLFSDDDTLEYKESQIRQLTYTYTCQATVLFACQVARVKGPNLVIHIVGARDAEIDQAGAWTLIPAYLKSVKNVTFVMVGPEIGGEELPKKFSYQTESDAVIKFVLVKADYKSYAKSKEFQEPDLVAALNCGFIFYTSWDRSLDSMIRQSGVPLVFTEYYLQDCQLNLEKLKQNTKKTVETILEPKVNPFCSRFAARIPAGFGLRKYGRKNVLMSNDFICVVKAKSSTNK